MCGECRRMLIGVSSLQNPPPYLDIDGRISYLVNRGNLASKSACSQRVRDYLEHNNFHFFLGYLRNYVTYGGRGGLDAVVDICELDAKVSLELFSGIQRAERGIRSCFVEAYCAAGLDPCTYYLQDESYRITKDGEHSLARSIRSQILRASEPYIKNKVQESCYEQGIPHDDLGTRTPEEQVTALSTLPIWSTIDWWTFGTLSRCVPALRVPGSTSLDQQTLLIGPVAERLNVGAEGLARQLESVSVLRNLVAHHSRLWARPAPVTPKFPSIYRLEKNRTTWPQSGYVPVLTLASFLHGIEGNHSFRDSIGDLVDSNPEYSIGMRRSGAMTQTILS